MSEPAKVALPRAMSEEPAIETAARPQLRREVHVARMMWEEWLRLRAVEPLDEKKLQLLSDALKAAIHDLKGLELSEAEGEVLHAIEKEFTTPPR